MYLLNSPMINFTHAMNDLSPPNLFHIFSNFSLYNFFISYCQQLFKMETKSILKKTVPKLVKTIFNQKEL
jgi:hypothetical protein